MEHQKTKFFDAHEIVDFILKLVAKDALRLYPCLEAGAQHFEPRKTEKNYFIARNVAGVGV